MTDVMIQVFKKWGEMGCGHEARDNLLSLPWNGLLYKQRLTADQNQSQFREFLKKGCK